MATNLEGRPRKSRRLMAQKGIVAEPTDARTSQPSRLAHASPGKPNLGVQHLLLRSPTDQRRTEVPKPRPTQQLQVPVIVNSDADDLTAAHAVETPPSNRRVLVEDLDEEAVASSVKDKLEEKWDDTLDVPCLSPGSVGASMRRVAGPFRSRTRSGVLPDAALSAAEQQQQQKEQQKEQQEEQQKKQQQQPKERPPDASQGQTTQHVDQGETKPQSQSVAIDLEDDSHDDEPAGDEDGEGAGGEQILKVVPENLDRLEATLQSWLTIWTQTSPDELALPIQAMQIALQLTKQISSILDDELPPLAPRASGRELPKELEKPLSNIARTLQAAIRLSLDSAASRPHWGSAGEPSLSARRLRRLRAREEASWHEALLEMASPDVLADLRELREASGRGVYLASRLLTSKLERERAELVRGLSETLTRQLALHLLRSDLAVILQWDASTLVEPPGSAGSRGNLLPNTASSPPPPPAELRRTLEDVQSHVDVLQARLEALPASSDDGGRTSALRFLSSVGKLGTEAVPEAEERREESPNSRRTMEARPRPARHHKVSKTEEEEKEKETKEKSLRSRPQREALLAAEVAARLSLLGREACRSEIARELTELEEVAESLRAAISRACKLASDPDLALEYAKTKLEAAKTDEATDSPRLSELQQVLARLRDPLIQRAALEAVAEELRVEAVAKSEELKEHLKNVEKKRRSHLEQFELESLLEKPARSICKLVSRQVPPRFEPSREELKDFASSGERCSQGVLDLLLSRAGLLLSDGAETFILNSSFWHDLSNAGAADGDLAWAAAQHWLDGARSTHERGIFDFETIVLPILRPNSGWTLAVVRNISAAADDEAPPTSTSNTSPSIELYNLAQVETLRLSQVLHLLRGFFAREWAEMGQDLQRFDVEKLRVLRLAVAAPGAPTTTTTKTGSGSGSAAAGQELLQLHSGLLVLEITRRLLVTEGGDGLAQAPALPDLETLKAHWQRIASKVAENIEEAVESGDEEGVTRRFKQLQALLREDPRGPEGRDRGSQEPPLEA